jgi:O-antigen ligase
MSHIDYSMVLALAALLTLNRILNTELAMGPRLAWAANFALIVSGLLINLGRSGQLAFAGGFLALGLHWAGRRSLKTTVAFVAGSALIFALVWAAAPRLRHRIEGARDELRAALVDHQYHSNLGTRVGANIVAAEMVRSRPVFGTGVGANMPEFRRLLDTEFPHLKPAIYWFPHLHSQYAQVATELGLAGLLSLAWVFWEILRGPYRSREADGAAIVLATVYIIGFLGDPFLHKQIPLVAFAVFVGLLAHAGKDPSLRNGESAKNT